MSKKDTDKNTVAWQELFLKYDILNKISLGGKYIISADQIRKYREPRLMAKFDHRINLPDIFSKNNLSILPVSRSEYVISDFDAYNTFEKPVGTITRMSLPSHIQSLNENYITSESIAINCAVASEMLSDFLCEDILIPTVSGRMGTGKFNFSINNLRSDSKSCVQVCKSQIEIDCALEGIESLTLLEAKRHLSEDFLIRQLYYPFRVWKERVAKRVKTVFMVYSNSIFRFYEYEFQDFEVYNSLVLVKQKNYSIEDTSIESSDVFALITQIKNFLNEPKIPFPQANSFSRVINLCELLINRKLNCDEITSEYAFDIRQTNYYTDAARYLGLVKKNKVENTIQYSLSTLGKQIMSMNYKKRHLALCKQILEHKVFYDSFKLCQNGVVPDKETIVEIMKKSSLYEIKSEATFFRRASTIISWINWMLGLA